MWKLGSVRLVDSVLSSEPLDRRKALKCYTFCCISSLHNIAHLLAYLSMGIKPCRMKFQVWSTSIFWASGISILLALMSPPILAFPAFTSDIVMWQWVDLSANLKISTCKNGLLSVRRVVRWSTVILNTWHRGRSHSLPRSHFGT